MAARPGIAKRRGERDMATGVTGIGGVFFRARDPDALRTWYATHLGVGSASEYVWMQAAGPTVFMPFPADTDHFPQDRAFMLNLRTDDLDALLAALDTAGIEAITKPEWDDPSTGRFARIHDPEGNPIELWQPPVE
jgi:predicted enzyme related to lactoylglutathione lyase